MKKFAVLMLAIMLTISTSVSVSAFEPNDVPTFYYEYINSVQSTLIITQGTATCTSILDGYYSVYKVNID